MSWACMGRREFLWRGELDYVWGWLVGRKDHEFSDELVPFGPLSFGSKE